MKTQLTIRIPDRIMARVDSLILSGHYQSRSLLVTEVLKNWLRKKTHEKRNKKTKI